MPIVNYVREHTRFIEYASDEGLSSSERLLWYALMHCMNQRAQGNVWPDEFIRISNDRLLLLTPMKFDSLAKARNGLKQRGLIEFVPGEKNKKPPQYRMNYFYPQYVAPATEQDGEESNPKNTDNHGYNMGDNHGYNVGYNMGDNQGDNVGDNSINDTGIHVLYPKPGSKKGLENTSKHAGEGEAADLPGVDGHWQFSTKARAATAQIVVDKIIEEGLPARMMGNLYDNVYEAMTEGVSPRRILYLARTSGPRPAQFYVSLGHEIGDPEEAKK